MDELSVGSSQTNSSRSQAAAMVMSSVSMRPDCRIWSTARVSMRMSNWGSASVFCGVK